MLKRPPPWTPAPIRPFLGQLAKEEKNRLLSLGVGVGLGVALGATAGSFGGRPSLLMGSVTAGLGALLAYFAWSTPDSSDLAQILSGAIAGVGITEVVRSKSQ